ncbi:MAG: hypothetical protein HFF26_03130 [Oscillospiraceae bacterium]|nr:hypothetical protein [Oscillospiraceae bacterium]
MVIKIGTAGMTRDEWLQERRSSLGGSDVGAILGMNQYASPYTVWAEKTGRLPPKEDNEAMRQGRDLEQYVAERFMERSGKQVQKYSYLLRSDSAPHLHSNIDRRVLGERSGLECKTASALSLKLYSSGEFPESYYAQCVAYLAVTGWDRWYLAALVLNKAFYIYQITTVEEDTVPDWCDGSVYVCPEEIETLKRCAAQFWEEYIVPDKPPPPDGTEATGGALQDVYPEDDGGVIELFGRDGLVKDYFRFCSERDSIQKEINAIKQTIQSDMGENSTAVCAAARVSWKAQARRTLDAKALQKAHPEISLSPFYRETNSRVFRIKKIEEEN